MKNYKSYFEYQQAKDILHFLPPGQDLEGRSDVKLSDRECKVLSKRFPWSYKQLRSYFKKPKK